MASHNGTTRVRRAPDPFCFAAHQGIHSAAISSAGLYMKLMEFQDGDRTFSCEAKSSPATPGTDWWWISITGESQRYAAFRTESGDNKVNLRQRVLAYYAHLLAERERPREPGGAWAARRNAQQAAAKAANTAAAAAAAAALSTATEQ
jgi:hypothetical protein